MRKWKKRIRSRRWRGKGGVEISLLIYKQRFQNPNLKSTANKNYAHVRYIATRPGVAKNEGRDHGLFGCLIPGMPLTEFPRWEDVAQLVYRNAKRHVTMYRSVVSFGEDTAKELLLTDREAWQRYIENHIRTIAEKNSIRRENFQWAAALHREKKHPHLHIVFWDDSDEKAKIKNPFTHPSVPAGIRRQMIKDTFARQIREYGREKDRTAAGLRKIGNDLTEDFERHIRLLGHKKYRKFREAYDLDAELAEDFDFSDVLLNEIAARIFRLKSAIPARGRIAYQLLPENVKKQTDGITGYLISQMPQLKKRKTDYVESKMKMVSLYGGSKEFLQSRRRLFEDEADKIIANRILGMVKTLNRLDDEGRMTEYREGRRMYYVEQMLIGILDMLSVQTDTNCQRYDRFACVWGGELSTEARKEWYLKNQDKGYEH